MRISTIFCLLIVVLGCETPETKENTPFEREKELYSYFSKIDFELDDSTNHIFILQTNRCGSCTEEVLTFISSEFSDSISKKTFILSSESEAITRVLKKISNSMLYIDSNNRLGKHGLSYAEDIYLKFNKKGIENWFFMNHQTLKNL